MADDNRIRLTERDLFSPQVNAVLEMQQQLQRNDDFAQQPLIIRVIFASWFYLAVAAGLGAAVGWACIEPFFSDRGEAQLANFLLFPTVGAAIGLFLGAAEGLMCRNVSRAAICGLVGLGIGFGGGLVAIFAAGMIFGIMVQLAAAFWKNPRPDAMPTGIALLFLMMGRSAAWAIAAVPAGIGQGIALREKSVVINGLVGGALGGALGGLLFDPICLLITGPTGAATLSRGVGFICIGLSVGAMVGLVEGWTKSAWLLMRAGPLAGKQFVIHRNAIILGSSPKADVYLFKDPAIEPRHAVIHNRGGRFEIEDCGTPEGTYVNGSPVQRQWLASGDKIGLGKTVLEFLLKETKSG